MISIIGAAWTVVLLVGLGALLAVHLRGDRLDVVLSGSMEPTIPAGSLVVVAHAEPVVGDVAVFEQPGSGRLVTHRIIGASAGDGEVSYRTKGDGNPTSDADLVPRSHVRGLVIAHVPAAGRALHRLKGPTGLGLLLGPPALALVASALGEIRPSGAAST